MTSEEVLPVVLYFFNFFAMLCVLFFFPPIGTCPKRFFCLFHSPARQRRIFALRGQNYVVCCLLLIIYSLSAVHLFCVILCSCWMQQEKNLVELRLAIISTKSNAIFPPLRSFASSLSSISTSFHFETEHRVPQLINDSHALHHFGARSVCRHIVPRRQQFSLIKLSPRGSEKTEKTRWTNSNAPRNHMRNDKNRRNFSFSVHSSSLSSRLISSIVLAALYSDGQLIHFSYNNTTATAAAPLSRTLLITSSAVWGNLKIHGSSTASREFSLTTSTTKQQQHLGVFCVAHSECYSEASYSSDRTNKKPQVLYYSF